MRVGAGVVGMGFLEGILVADVGALDAVSIMFMLPMRSMVESKSKP